MKPALKTTRTNFVYSSGTIKILKENKLLGFTDVILDTQFLHRRDLRKVLFKYWGSDLIITIKFDDPEDKKATKEKIIEEI